MFYPISDFNESITRNNGTIILEDSGFDLTNNFNSPECTTSKKYVFINRYMYRKILYHYS